MADRTFRVPVERITGEATQSPFASVGLRDNGDGTFTLKADPLPYAGDQTGGSVVIPNGSASAATALPAGTTRLSLFSDVACFVRFGTGAVAATTASIPLLPSVPYELAIRPGETFVSVWGLSAAGTLRWFRLDSI